MGVAVADGTQLGYASTFGTSKAVSAVTNANPAVATLEASHGIVVNDIMVFVSGWPDLSDKVLRASVVSTNDVTLEGFSTANTSKFPTGSGTGSIREVTAWTNIAQIVSFNVAGGDPVYTVYQFLNELTKRRAQLAKEPLTVEFELADDISLAQQAAIRALEDGGVAVPMRMILANNSKIYLNGTWSMSNLPTLAIGEINKRKVGFALTSLPTEYST